jgi:ribulose kinase
MEAAKPFNAEIAKRRAKKKHSSRTSCSGSAIFAASALNGFAAAEDKTKRMKQTEEKPRTNYSQLISTTTLPQ